MHLLRRRRRQLRNFLARPLWQQLGLPFVWLLLGISRLAVLTVPFRHLAPLLGPNQGVECWVPLATPRQQHRGIQIGRTVRTAARVTPWDSNCLAQALTAALLLRLSGVPHAIHLGVARDRANGSVKAHAWVSSGRVRVTGGDGFRRFTVVSSFLSLPAAPGAGAVRRNPAV